MIAVIDAQLAWWPPTFSPSALSRTWLAWWMVQAESKRSRSSIVFNAWMSGACVFLSIRERLASAPSGKLADQASRQCLEGVDGVEDRRYALALGVADFGPPHVEQQDDPHFPARVSRFVLDAVVEDQQFAFFPLAGFVADAQPAARRGRSAANGRSAGS